MTGLWVKICGLMDPEEAVAVARCGASAIGFICVPSSPRYVTPTQVGTLAAALRHEGWEQVERVGVFANADTDAIAVAITQGHLTTLQLHGQESPEDCRDLRVRYPDLALIKAFRIRTAGDLAKIAPYTDTVDRILLDAYHPHLLGGTGHTLDWDTLKSFRPILPWILAGGLTPGNIATALAHLTPDGIDLSSGVEISPGHKDVTQVQHLLRQLDTVIPSVAPHPGS
ncbi:phosphoribosylanthranilate isomerase [Leptolyngbya sp. PCC 6406]|uniref:phosphoribosylanthranilate isomerase n=1 Tax=Leptolyngbya sp. PCC 6406 TaxID=1173264 RepID=UPI0002ACEC1E|nr:phosphoribosylanthranilate isomerase [Leptolyngbya sp. PCC 6406]